MPITFRTLETEQAKPVAETCDYDSGSMYDCVPLCSAKPVLRLFHLVPCYGWFVADLCKRHELPMRGRVYPDKVHVEPIAASRRA